MAARTKAQSAESNTPEKTEEQKAEQAKEAGEKLVASLKTDEPVGGEQEKDEKNGKEKKPPLALDEIDGEITDGQKVKIGVPMLGGVNAGASVNRTFFVPKTYRLAKAVKGNQVHVIDDEHPEKTICTLPLPWPSGEQVMPADTYISCTPCSRRMIAIQKLTQADHEARLKKLLEAKAEVLKLMAEAKAKAKEAKEAAAVTSPATPAAPVAVEPKKEEAKPDPKPTTRRRAKAA